jgi:hypothetical protein
VANLCKLPVSLFAHMLMCVNILLDCMLDGSVLIGVLNLNTFVWLVLVCKHQGKNSRRNNEKRELFGDESETEANADCDAE